MNPDRGASRQQTLLRKWQKSLGVKDVLVVANKVRGNEDLAFIKAGLGGMKFIGHISFNNLIMEADIKGIPPYKSSPDTVEEIRKIKNAIEHILDEK